MQQQRISEINMRASEQASKNTLANNQVAKQMVEMEN